MMAMEEPDFLFISSKLEEKRCRLKVQKGEGAAAKTSGALKDVMQRLPEGLTGSFNLGHADIFPATSGKHNAACHLMQCFGAVPAQTMLLCDDDNDLGDVLIH